MSPPRCCFLWALPVALLFFTAGCRPTGPEAEPREGPVRVVATFDLLADLVTNVGGDHVEVRALTPSGRSPREFVPDEDELRAVAEADIFVEAGLQFEPWADNLYRSAGNRPRRLPLAHLVTLLPEPEDAREMPPPTLAPEHVLVHEHEENREHDHESPRGHDHDGAAAHRHGHGEGEHTHSQYDPEDGSSGLDARFWLDLRRLERAVVGIRNALERADPENGPHFRENAESYIRHLSTLDQRIRDALVDIPEERRRIVTDVNRFQYFAERYGLEVIVLLPAGGESAVSAAELAGWLRESAVSTVFTARAGEAETLEEAAGAAGAKVIRLYVETLGADGLSFIEAMEQNLEALLTALHPSS